MKKFKYFRRGFGFGACFIFAMCTFVACGFASRDNEAIGQVKKVKQVTPILCPNYTQVHLSLGVMRNGVGSVSTEDMVLYVPGLWNGEKLKISAENGALVKVKYDVARVTLCVPEALVTSVEVLK